eukprot:TRINITY_DN2882_c0_g1_i5.p1 TRINITY_DN2882_c0_g1~~TRINITY_DN2882_c0_g1_i5.p1  ORF type:complete len:473 (-),score=89.02 TRINITY_DN2882_c0_g1_i5:159-1517(-)
MSFSQELEHALSVVFRQEPYSPEEAKKITEEVVTYWKENINPGFLTYRKSVADDFAALEWRDGEPGGSVFVSLTGKEYLDCLGGFGIFSTGHRHPKIVAAVKAQLEKQALHSQELLDPLRTYCAHLLAMIAPGDLKYSFFTNSGTESVEACLKMAMMATGRSHFVATIGAFHGKTLGSLSGTSKAAYRVPFKGALLDFAHLPLNDIAAIEAHFKGSEFSGNKIAGVIVEPVQGEGGIYICTDEYLRTLRRLCTEYGAMLIFDEVQSGMGRTGKWWGCDHAGVVPDIMAVGKAFGGGVMPSGACIAREAVWEKYIENPFIMTTTFGGNPLAMAASIATMEVIHSENLVEQARAKGEYFKNKLLELQEKFPHHIVEIRGRGLMIGIDFLNNEFGYEFSKNVFGRGLLVSGTLVNARVIRVEPPLRITYEEIDKAINIMHAAMIELLQQPTKSKL